MNDSILYITSHLFMSKGLNSKVDAYIERSQKWQKELTKLRAVVLSCAADLNLVEELKWGVPCYTYQGTNVVLLHEFKDYCAILFCKGSLLQDRFGLLVQQTKNTQAARQARFHSVKEVSECAQALQQHIAEAVAIEQAGLKVVFKDVAEFEVVEEFQHVLDTNAKLKKAFAALSPGRQRAYLLHFAGAKQSKTRIARIEKYKAAILAGKGLND